MSYLAERHHFTAYLQESGFVEGWLVKDWVRGGKGGLGQVMAQGLTSLMRLWAQMRAVEWMRTGSLVGSDRQMIWRVRHALAFAPPHPVIPKTIAHAQKRQRHGAAGYWPA